MGAVSITMPQKLWVKLKEKAEETDSLPEELGVELLSKSLNEELDPEWLIEHYQSLSEKYITEAKEFLSKGDFVQASEKLWGATALTVKMVAAKRGLKLEKHGGLWDFVSRLSREGGDKELILLFHAANGLHKNFYENELDKDAVEITAESVEKLIDKLRRIS
ncbi:MAG: PaREP1 family protein [archaeon]|nr:PaREP1 family protein [archaeon]